MSDFRGTLIVPSWEALWQIYRECTRIFASSPWISAEGVQFLERVREENPEARWEIWTRLDALDYLQGYSDYPSLLHLWERIGEGQMQVLAADNLHLKLFWNGLDQAMVGSCNLTQGGFKTNLETAIVFNPPSEAIAVFLGSYRPKLRPLSLNQLRSFVSLCTSPEILGLKTRFVDLRKEAASVVEETIPPRKPPYYFPIR